MGQDNVKVREVGSHIVYVHRLAVATVKGFRLRPSRTITGIPNSIAFSYMG